MVELDDVLSGVSMTSSDSSKSYGHFYLRECTVDLDKIPYELQVEDERYFSDYSDYSKTGEDFEALVNKITPVYKDVEDFSGVSRENKNFSPRGANVIKCNSSSDLNDTYFNELFFMYPVFFWKNNQVESYVSLSENKDDKKEIILTEGYDKLSSEM